MYWALGWYTGIPRIVNYQFLGTRHIGRYHQHWLKHSKNHEAQHFEWKVNEVLSFK